MPKEYKISSKVKGAPQTIGVYQFLKGREVLYVGKAVNIKARLASHLANARFDPKEAAIVEGATRVKVTPVESEFKALLLEAQLIQKLHPKYNRRWKDNKSPLYIHVTSGEYPKILTNRGKDLKQIHPKGVVFGPFPSTQVVQELIREIRKVIPFCTRKRIGKQPCFHSKIGLCDPCPNEIVRVESKRKREESKRQYRKNIRQVVRILKGQTEPVLKDLEKQLEELSDKQKYEEALVVRNRTVRFERLISQTLGIKEETIPQQDAEKSLESLAKLLTAYFPGLTNLKRIEAYDVSNIGGREATASMVVLTEGRVDKSQYRKFKIVTSNQRPAIRLGDVGMLGQVVARRFKNKWPKPDLIVVDGGKPQVRAVQKALKEANQRVPTVGIAKAPDRLLLGVDRLPTKRLPQNHPGFNLVRLIRDESHRFSRRYHLFLREKELMP
ncbi:GIY-YIG nuclease family protein [Candidatus Saccharibacteria bacterium]|nr:GIY-YIG nuclease family protein [Candidatus Saccharibacteria bacterium]